MSEKMLTRIGALLRKAESTDNEHEADAYLAAAQRLATLSSVDLAVARSHVADSERRPTPVQRTIEIGESRKRGLRTYVQLFVAISLANDVRCDVTRDSSRVFAYGFDTDIEMVQALYASLVVQMVRSCDAYLKSPEFADDVEVRAVRREVRGRTYRAYEQRPVHPTTARINFQQAFAGRIGERLTAAKRRAQQEVIEQPEQAGVEIVLRHKELELTDFYSANSTARGHWDGYRATSYSERSQRAGDRAGRDARLGRTTAIGGAPAGISTR